MMLHGTLVEYPPVEVQRTQVFAPPLVQRNMPLEASVHHTSINVVLVSLSADQSGASSISSTNGAQLGQAIYAPNNANRN